jgi:RND family efflux transporter MFP subunit
VRFRVKNGVPMAEETRMARSLREWLSMADSLRPTLRLLVLVSAVAVALAVGLAIGARQRATVGVASAQTGASEGMSSMTGMGAGPPPPPAGATSSAVYIPPARQQLIGVRTGLVERQQVSGSVRAVGVLAYDQTRIAEIHTKVSGWVEHLFVDYVGKPVRRGQPLFSVYSPDLVTAEADYSIALRARKQLGAGSGEAALASDALLAAARERLRRWDVSDTEIAALESGEQPSRIVTLFSPFDGVLLEKTTFVRQYVTPEMSAFKVADLSSLWAVGEVFEYEASAVHLGQPVEVEFPYGQSPHALSTTIDFVWPDIDPQTRRVRFRASLDNRTLHLKPDTYVQLVVHGEDVDRLVVPKEAIIDTGTRRYALVALPDGYFDPRTVEVGPPLGDFYPVVSGLAEGDRVVTSAQFLVDSETNLASAMQNMGASMPGMNMGTSQPAPSTKPAPPMPGMSGMPNAPPSSSSPPHTPAPGQAPSRPAVPARPPAPPPSSASVSSMPRMPGMDMPMPSSTPMPPGHRM